MFPTEKRLRTVLQTREKFKKIYYSQIAVN